MRLVADLGAYIRTHGDVVPSHSSASFPGPYRVRSYRAQAIAALSNKTPCGTVRAPGMFEANFARERAVDLLADKLAIDRAEIRRRNLIRPDEMPWAVGTESVRRPTIFDSGDFPAVFERALSEFGWDRPLPPGAPDRSAGDGHRGPGRAIGVRAVRGPRLAIDPHGHVLVASGCSSQGQGHETVLAQVAADVLGVPLERIAVRHGDTALIPFGGGSYASRTAVMSGHAVYSAAVAVKEKAIRTAAQKLEVAEEDLRLVDGRVELVGASGLNMTLGAIARIMTPGNTELLKPPTLANIPTTGPLGRPPISGPCPAAPRCSRCTLPRSRSTRAPDRSPSSAIWSRPTSAARSIRCWSRASSSAASFRGWAARCSRRSPYGDDGQLQTGTFADYMLPSANEAPPITALVIEHVRSSSNPLGVKGVGEVGPSGVAAAIGNAVAHAIGKGARINTLPLTPERMLDAATISQSFRT